MYCSFFQLERMPFANTPDPRFFFVTADHEEALAALSYGVTQQRGITLVTAKSGCGKTMLGRMLLESFGRGAPALTITNAPENGRDLIISVCRGLSVRFAAEDSTAELIERLHSALISGFGMEAPVAVIIDEAHRLSPGTLDQVCSLANMETTTTRLLQIVLLGQPELMATLRDPRFEQLRQHIFCVRQLQPLDLDKTRCYIRHRLECAGAGSTDFFRQEAADLIHHRSGGVPRIINQLADNALLSAFGGSKTHVDRQTVADMLAQMMDLSSPVPPTPMQLNDPARNAGAATGTSAPTVAPQSLQEAAVLQGSLMQLVRAGSEIAERLTEANRTSVSQTDKFADCAGQLADVSNKTIWTAKRFTTPRTAAEFVRRAAGADAKTLRSRLDEILTRSRQLDRMSGISGRKGQPLGTTAADPGRYTFQQRAVPSGPRRQTDSPRTQPGRFPTSPGILHRARRRKGQPSPADVVNKGRFASGADGPSNLQQELHFIPGDTCQGVCQNLERLGQRLKPMASSLTASVNRLNTGHDNLTKRFEQIRAGSQKPTKVEKQTTTT